jgi:hypothetical protein
LNWLGIVLEATLPHLIKNLTKTTTRQHVHFDRDIMNGDYLNRACEISSRIRGQENGDLVSVNRGDDVPLPYRVGACQFECAYEPLETHESGWNTFPRGEKNKRKHGSVHWLSQGTQDNWRCHEAVLAVNNWAKETGREHVRFFTDISTRNTNGVPLVRYRCHPNFLPTDKKKPYPWFDWVRYRVDNHPGFCIGRIVVFAVLEQNGNDGTGEELVCVLHELGELRPDSHIPFSAAGTMKHDTPLIIVPFDRMDGPICVVPSPTAGELQQLLDDSESSFEASQVTTFVTVPPRRIWSEVPMAILERLLVE